MVCVPNYAEMNRDFRADTSTTIGHNEPTLRTDDVQIAEKIDFSGLLLSDPVFRGLAQSGFLRPSPIQLQAIPLGKCGLDLVVQAKSGTGKTCVFSVIALENLNLTLQGLQTLIIAPTREIAVQIAQVIIDVGCKIPGLKCCAFIGGLPVKDDEVKLRKCHIAVGTPGRIKQLIESEVLNPTAIRLLVLDEADKLMNSSFLKDINFIFSRLPENKQLIAASATYPPTLAELVSRYMRNPTFVRLNQDNPVLIGVKQFVRVLPQSETNWKTLQDKVDVVIDILSSISFNQCMIFSNFSHKAESVCHTLQRHGWPTTFMSGAQDQKDRLKTMQCLRSYNCRVMITTDLTARGIDIRNVNLVINLDLPMDLDTYLHRIGRVGRYGGHGLAINIISDGQELSAFNILKRALSANIQTLPERLDGSVWTEVNPATAESEVTEADIQQVNAELKQLSISEKPPDASTKITAVADVHQTDSQADFRAIYNSCTQRFSLVGCQSGACISPELRERLEQIRIFKRHRVAKKEGCSSSKRVPESWRGVKCDENCPFIPGELRSVLTDIGIFTPHDLDTSSSAIKVGKHKGYQRINKFKDFGACGDSKKQVGDMVTTVDVAVEVGSGEQVPIKSVIESVPIKSVIESVVDQSRTDSLIPRSVQMRKSGGGSSVLLVEDTSVSLSFDLATANVKGLLEDTPAFRRQPPFKMPTIDDVKRLTGAYLTREMPGQSTSQDSTFKPDAEKCEKAAKFLSAQRGNFWQQFAKRYKVATGEGAASSQSTLNDGVEIQMDSEPFQPNGRTMNTDPGVMTSSSTINEAVRNVRLSSELTNANTSVMYPSSTLKSAPSEVVTKISSPEAAKPARAVQDKGCGVSTLDGSSSLDSNEESSDGDSDDKHNSEFEAYRNYCWQMYCSYYENYCYSYESYCHWYWSSYASDWNAYIYRMIHGFDGNGG